MRKTDIVLLLEDDEVDILSAQRAFKELDIPNPLVVMKNGEEALNMLRNPDNQLPGLIILDLNMPKINGIEFLKTYKRDDRLRWIPSVVLTTSSNHTDIINAFANQTAGYIVKPLDFNEFKTALKKVFDYWQLCELPEMS